MKLVEFTDSVSDTPVHVEKDHVQEVRPEPNDPANITVIYYDNGKQVGVKGKHTDVAKKLNS